MKHYLHLCLLALLLTAFGGCGGKKPRADNGSDYGPLPPASEESTTTSEQGGASTVGPDAPVGPVPSPDFVPPKDGYVFVFGPGLARSLAFIGVLHELEHRNLPIRAIVGVEMGAVIAGVWAGSNLNNLEWEMHKFKRQTLLDMPMLGIGRKIAEGKRLYAFLDRALKVSLLQKMKVPVIVASGTRNEGEEGATLYETNGSAKDIIRGSMGIPGVIKSYEWEGQERITAALESPFPAKAAKDLGLGQVICVNVLGRGDDFKAKGATEEQLAALMRSVATTARSQLKDCDEVVTIPTDGIGYFDFDAKADLIFRGKVAVKKWIQRARD